MMKRLLIIGAGMATARLLKELAALDHDWHITVVSAEKRACYNRITLSSLLAGDVSEDELDLLDTAWFQRQGVTLIQGEAVSSLDTAGRTITTEAGGRHEYDALVIATGSKPNMPDIPGIASDDVVAFRNLDDLERIRGLARPGSRAVVVGGGLLGLEAAAGLSAHDVETTVLNRGNWLMNRQLDEMGGIYLQRSLQAMGIHFELGSSPRAILQTEQHNTAVELSDGRRLDCNLVLMAAGIAPHCDLAREAGLTCRRGIVVNGLLQTSRTDVYALGECCEIDEQLFGLVEPVYQQAAILARVLCAQNTEVFIPHDSGVQLKVAGVQVAAAGSMPFPAQSRSQVLTDAARGIYRRLVFHEQKLVGYVLVGDTRHSAWYREMMASGATPRSLMMFGQTAAENQAVQMGVES